MGQKKTPARDSPAEEGTVFVIDDDPSVRKALVRLIRSAGLRVESFPSAQAFLARDPGNGVSCAVVDLQMPEVSGLDLQELLKRADRPIPLIFLTGHGDVPSSVRAMKRGAVDFIQKPCKDRDLFPAIAQALARDRRAGAERAERREIQSRLDTLTPRESQVFRGVVTGSLNKQIAADLGIAEKTIKVHRARVMEKMKAGSLADLVRMALTLGIRGAGRGSPGEPGGAPEPQLGGASRSRARSMAPNSSSSSKGL